MCDSNGRVDCKCVALISTKQEQGQGREQVRGSIDTEKFLRLAVPEELILIVCKYMDKISLITYLLKEK